MAKEHYVVFGAEENPTKGLLARRCDKHEPGEYAVEIVELDNDGSIHYGDLFEVESISKRYTTLYFCKREGLDTFIRALKKIQDSWGLESEMEE